MLARLTWLQRQNNRYEWYQFGPFKEKWICKSFQRILKLQARQSYPLVTQDSDTRRRPSAVQRHTESIICGVRGVHRGRRGDETFSNWSRRTSELEAIWESELEEPRRSGGPTPAPASLWLSPHLFPHLPFISLQPAPLLHFSFLFFFLAGFTNGLVTMEIAARETLTYSGWGQKFESFCGGIHSSSSAFQSYYAH